jgi:hypothetical protein
VWDDEVPMNGIECAQQSPAAAEQVGGVHGVYTLAFGARIILASSMRTNFSAQRAYRNQSACTGVALWLQLVPECDILHIAFSRDIDIDCFHSPTSNQANPRTPVWVQSP